MYNDSLHVLFCHRVAPATISNHTRVNFYDRCRHCIVIEHERIPCALYAGQEAAAEDRRLKVISCIHILRMEFAGQDTKASIAWTLDNAASAEEALLKSDYKCAVMTSPLLLYLTPSCGTDGGLSWVSLEHVPMKL